MANPAKNAELLKHRLSLALEARKWVYRKQELQYLESGQHLRSLNQLMWQVPGMAIAITGGLWYGATTIDSDTARAWVFSFAALVDTLIVVILWRLRTLIQIHIDHQMNFAGQAVQKDRSGWIVVRCWAVTLFAAAGVSTIGAFHSDTLAKRQSPERQGSCCSVILDSPQQCVVSPPPTAPHKIQPKKTPACGQ